MKIKLLSLITFLFLIFSINAKAGFDEGKSAFEKGDFATAKQELQPLADKGNPAAQNIIGRLYCEGKGETVDYNKAMEWFRKAADQGYPNSQNNIGSMYFNGQGVEQDNAKAFEWYSKAAEQGLATAQYTLGWIYHDKLTNYKLAVEWYRKAAAQGDADAQTNLGYAYDSGQGVEQDYVQAVEWYKKAAAQGNEIAKNNLAIATPKAQAQQQKKFYEANGYKLISLIDFKLDAKSMKKGTKILMQGYLEVEGEMFSLSDFMPLAKIPHKLKVYLLTDNSPREVRQKLLEFKPSFCGLFAMCKPLVLGHVSKCTQTFAGKKIRDTFCLEVDEIRRESPNYN